MALRVVAGIYPKCGLLLFALGGSMLACERIASVRDLRHSAGSTGGNGAIAGTAELGGSASSGATAGGREASSGAGGRGEIFGEGGLGGRANVAGAGDAGSANPGLGGTSATEGGSAGRGSGGRSNGVQAGESGASDGGAAAGSGLGAGGCADADVSHLSCDATGKCLVGNVPDSAPSIGGIAVHDSVVVWTEQNLPRRVHVRDLTLDQATNLLMPDGTACAPASIAFDAHAELYWSCYTAACLMHTSGARTAVAALADGCYASIAAYDSEIALGDASVFFILSPAEPTAPSELWARSTEDETQAKVAALDFSAAGPAIDETFVYWGSYDADSDTGTIKRMPRTGVGITETVGECPGVPVDLVTRDGYVYWLSRKGSTLCRKSTHDGTAAVERLAPGDSYSSASSMAIDDDFIYWTDEHGGRVMRAAKMDGASASVFYQNPVGSTDDPVFVSLGCSGVYFTTVNGNVQRVSKR